MCMYIDITSNASTTSTSVETVESSTTTESEATPTATTSATTGPLVSGKHFPVEKYL